MADSFGEFEATSLFCTRCQRATPTRKKLLLVLPTGNKYDYACSVCGAQVGGKTDSDTSAYRRLTPSLGTGSGPPPGQMRRPRRPV